MADASPSRRDALIAADGAAARGAPGSATDDAIPGAIKGVEAVEGGVRSCALPGPRRASDANPTCSTVQR